MGVMKKLPIILLVIFPFLLSAQLRTASGLTPQRTTINGLFEGYDTAVDSFRYIKLLYFHLYNGITETVIGEIDKNGKFSVTFPLISPQEIMLMFEGDLVMMYAIPGGTTNIFLDLAALKARRKLPPEVRLTYAAPLRFAGSYSKFNRDYNIFWPKLEIIKPYDEHKKMISSLDQKKYKSYRLAMMKVMLDTLAVFNRKQNTSSAFRNFMFQHICYWAAEDLLRYSWLHDQGKRVLLTKDYLDFVNRIPVNNRKALVTGKYALFLNEYLNMWMNELPYTPVITGDGQLYAYLRMDNKLTPEDAKALQIPDSNRTPAQKTLVAQLYSHYQAEYMNFKNTLNISDAVARQVPPGIGEDVMQARIICNYLNQHKNPLSTQNLQKMGRHIVNRDIYALIKQDNKNLKDKLAGKAPGNQPATELNLQQEQLYQKLISPYKGKVVYIDFWAPWCSPCMSEMPASKALAGELKSKDVVFLYIGVECNKESWEKTIKEKQLEGEHYYADKNESVLLSNKFNFSAIPRYVLIDKEGKVAEEDAPRPGMGLELKSRINALLGGN